MLKFTCSGGLVNAGGTDPLADTPDPDRISLRMPLIPRRSNVLAPKCEPLEQVESSRTNPCMQHGSRFAQSEHRKWQKRAVTELTVYVGVLRDAWAPPELLVEISDAACLTNPWLHRSSSLSGEEANASAIRVKHTEECSSTC